MKTIYKVCFLVIMIICFFFLFNDKLFFKSSYLKEIYRVIVIPINKINNEVNNIKNYKNNTYSYEIDNILLNNLKEENSLLLEENNYLKELIGLEKDYTNYIYAKVISRNRLYYFDTFIISKGSSDGISINDAIINKNGFIGRVISTSKNYSTVRMITSNYIDNKLSVIIKGKSTLSGNIKEYKDGYLIIECIGNYNEVSINDSVYTSDIGMINKNIYIGKVSKVVEDSYGISSILYVDISSYSDISYVMVLIND